MVLSDFRELPFSLKLGVLIRDGVLLLSRQTDQQHRVLYSLHIYYVEVGWDRAGQIQFVRSFTNTDGLEPYLAQLDWHQHLSSDLPPA